MSYLKAVPRDSELEPAARAVTVVSPDTRDVVYLDETASLEIITEALKAWGLRVRSERTSQTVQSEPAPVPAAVAPALTPVEMNWQTTRCATKAPGRLENELSPLWLPIRHPDRGTDTPAAWSWFSNAA